MRRQWWDVWVSVSLQDHRPVRRQRFIPRGAYLLRVVDKNAF